MAQGGRPLYYLSCGEDREQSCSFCVCQRQSTCSQQGPASNQQGGWNNQQGALRNYQGMPCSHQGATSLDVQRPAAHLPLTRISVDLRFPEFSHIMNQRSIEICSQENGSCLHHHSLPQCCQTNSHKIDACVVGETDRRSQQFHGANQCGHSAASVPSAMLSGQELVACLSPVRGNPAHGATHSANHLPYGIMVQEDASYGMNASYIEALEEHTRAKNQRHQDAASSGLAEPCANSTEWNGPQSMTITSTDNPTMWSLEEGAALREVIATKERDIHQLTSEKDHALTLIDMWQRRCAAAEREGERLRQQLRVLYFDQTGEDKWTGLSAYSGRS